jgi:hypothetical protein
MSGSISGGPPLYARFFQLASLKQQTEAEALDIVAILMIAGNEVGKKSSREWADRNCARCDDDVHQRMNANGLYVIYSPETDKQA